MKNVVRRTMNACRGTHIITFVFLLIMFAVPLAVMAGDPT